MEEDELCREMLAGGAAAAATSPVTPSHRRAASKTKISTGPKTSLACSQQRKRKRLNAVLDKLSSQLSVSGPKFLVGCADAETKTDGNPAGASLRLPVQPSNRAESRPRQAACDKGGKASLRRLEASNRTTTMYSKSTSGPGSSQLPLESDEAELPPAVQQRMEESDEAAAQDEPEPLRRPAAAIRREQWRDTQQQSVEEQTVTQRNYLQAQARTGSSNSSASSEVFKFDSFDKDRYLSPGAGAVSFRSSSTGGSPSGHRESAPTADFSSTGCLSSAAVAVAVAVAHQPPQLLSSLPCPAGGGPHHSQQAEDPSAAAASLSAVGSASGAGAVLGSSSSCDAEVLFASPVSGRSPHSSLSSPQISVDSPRICFSPLRIKDSIEEAEEDATPAAHTRTASGDGRRKLISLHHVSDPSDGGRELEIAVGAAAGQSQKRTILNLPKLSVRGCDDGELDSSPQTWIQGSSTSAAGSDILHPPAHQYYSSRGLTAQTQQHLQTTCVSRPLSPNLTPTTPISPSTPPVHGIKHLPIYLTEIYRRRCLSDTDLSASWDELSKSRSGSALPSSTGAAAAAAAAAAAGGGAASHSHSQSQRAIGAGLCTSRSASAASSHRSKLCRSPALVTGGGGGYLSLPTTKGGSLESEASGSSAHTQESPLDLSVRSSSSHAAERDGTFRLKSGVSMDSVVVPPLESSSLHVAGVVGGSRARGKSLNRNSGGRTRGAGSGGSVDRYSLDRLDHVSPVVETIPGVSTEVAYVCPICGQMFGE